MYYVGADLHKEKTWFYVMDRLGRRISSISILNSPHILKQYLSRLPQPFTIAVEATYNWYFFVDLAEEYAEKVYLVNSYELKAFAKRHKKTDKIDARLIADVLRKGYLPSVTIPDKDTRKMREFLHYRMNIVRDRTKNIVRLKALLDKLGEDSNGDFTTYKRLDNMLLYHLPQSYREIIMGYIERIKFLSRKLNEIAPSLEKKVSPDMDIMNLVTIPGISFFSAALIKSEIIDITRFRSFSKLCAYAGLAPRVAQSSHRTFHGPLNVNRRKNLQWILIENVFHFIKAVPQHTEKYEQIAKRKGNNTAKVVLAREMLKMVYHILKEKRPFYVNEPRKYKIRPAVTPALYGA